MLPPDDNSAEGRPVARGIEQDRRGRCAGGPNPSVSPPGHRYSVAGETVAGELRPGHNGDAQIPFFLCFQFFDPTGFRI